MLFSSSSSSSPLFGQSAEDLLHARIDVWPLQGREKGKRKGRSKKRVCATEEMSAFFPSG